MNRFRKWRLQRAEDELADTEHNYEHWIADWPNYGPGRKRREREQIEKLRTRVEKLRAGLSEEG